MTTIQILCPICNGTKTRSASETEVSCLSCEESGYLEWGKIVSDIEDKIDDILEKCNDIKEVVDEL